MNRVISHPIIEVKEKKKIKFYFEGKEYFAFEGETIASALFANGIKIFSYHKKDGSPQGIFCANGQCAQCSVVCNGYVVKACMEKVKDQMIIETLKGVGRVNIKDDEKLNYSSLEEIETDVLIIGGGPSGMSAASEIGKFNLDVILVDDKDKFGGKLVLQTHKFFGSVDDCYAGMRGIDIADKLYDELLKYPSLKLWNESICFGVFADKKIGVIRNNICYLIKPKAVIFATGAREKMILFEGNTLPGVYGAGAFQTLLNRDLVRPSQNLFIVGGGNVGLIAAYHAIQGGINVVGLCEIAKECGGYKVHQDKIKRYGVKIFTGHTIVKAIGKDCVEKVVIAEVDENLKPQLDKVKIFDVDTILIASGLNPVNELYHQAVMFSIPSFICGDASEIAEASAAMFSGKIAAHKLLKHLGFITRDVPEFWFKKLDILKSKPGKTYPVENTKKDNLKVYPVISCRQEIPCNPCVSVCPKKSIRLTGNDIRSIPKFDGECIGCFKCLLICPGLAITIVDARKDENMPVVWIGLEVDVNFKKGDKVIGVDIDGNKLGEFEVYEIRKFKAEKMNVVGIKVPSSLKDKVVSIRILSDWNDEKNTLNWNNIEEIKSASDDIIVCRCERVSLGEIRKWIRKGVRDLNQLKAITRAGMGACGSKTCGSLLINIMKSEGVDINDVVDLTKRPLFVEIEFASFLGPDKKEETSDNFSNF